MTFKCEFSDGNGQRELKIRDSNRGYLFSLGIEIGTLESFFSFERCSLGNARQTNVLFKHEGSAWAFESDLAFDTARLHVSEHGIAGECGGSRTLSVRALEPSHLMDSVLRFVIPKDQVTEARIGGRVISHEMRNRYHQFETDSVDLLMRGRTILKFSPDRGSLPSGFAAMVYLRDEPDDWILHFRALALTPSQFVLKGCNRFHNRPFPAFVQKLVFGFFPGLRQSLLFIRERVSQRIPIQVNGAAAVNPGDALTFSVRWVIEDA